eukprot:CAMPEP_0195522242 /NCGR_PEP_ID=MMETSP0794_2-20130614/20188_1 /TAXON_ID=515487 /ORGANISM="Stephanopyxis turris, Strain CCMP 815" /LENGTH=127 /DNA_ID=CAMNT_0040651949 /DNA_START=65 /DNA_END=445 /DNA_ORIENTATION=+
MKLSSAMVLVTIRVLAACMGDASALLCRQSCQNEDGNPDGCAWIESQLSINFYENNQTSTCRAPFDSGCAWFRCPGYGEWWGCRASLDCTIPCPGGSKICGTADWSNSGSSLVIAAGAVLAAAVAAA